MTIPSAAAYAEEADAAVRTAVAAAVAIEEVAAASTRIKDDGSPVTDADLASDRIIRRHLANRFPSDAILTEESGDSDERLSSERCWIVDPLDGTKQFIAGTGNYDVLIALVVKGRPVVAVSCNPPSRLVCFAVAGEGAWAGRDGDWQPLRFAPSEHGSGPRIVTSIWYGAPDSLPLLGDRLGEIVRAAPTVLETGFNPRYWASSDRPFDAFVGWVPEGWMSGGEWDLVVADLIIHEAGGACTDLQGELHQYNKPVARNTGGIIIASDPALHERLVASLSSTGANALR
jgi:3'-phosphoadenosine 5'-phosphosulfate (PAPS) 3'-phosphatase